MRKEEENVLIQKIKKGNHHLFEQLIVKYQSSLCVFIYKIVGNWDDARDICQDTFFKAYKYIRSYKGQAKFYNWLFQIGYNLSVNFIKRRKKHTEILKTMIPKPEPDRSMRKIEVKEIGAMIERIMLDIHHNFRTALHLFYKEEKSYNEIADIMKIPINTVKSHIFRGKEEIRRKLVEDYSWEFQMD